MQKSNVKSDYDHYLRLAHAGHYPLFFNDWLHSSMQQKSNLSHQRASHNVKHVFNQLARHKTLEKKKTALIGMDRISREEFIRSFFKIIEHEILKGNKSLQ
ncbi:MAG: hypothetical protein CME62_04565 [Halobacteriovoraceae bacterium]|nr:hypothetical protein [Halobacteriovoraceae bacterium]|tara:strand:- start:7980 stop:8282 length:303 start_codon:yes stop_codon:yes gene_type:complete